MHIPDGFLEPLVWGPMAVASGAVVAWCARKAKQGLREREIPLMGVMGAFIFAAQMINVPVAAGTSGHLSGGVLLAVLLGPYAAALVMTCVLVVQCFLFQDGGLTALGANIFNMGIVAAFPGYWIFVALKSALRGDRGYFAGSFLAAWAAVVLSAVLVAFELSLSGTTPLFQSLLAMTSVHAIIGLFEGGITVAVLRFIKSVRPDLLGQREGQAI